MSDVEEIKRRLDVRSVAAAYTEVFPSGPARQRCRCLCGQNSDRDPSVMLWPDHWHCFACGRHGSVIDLVMTVEGCDFRSALELIRRRWLRGEDVPLTRPIRPLPKPTELPADVLSALAAAQAFYAELLWADEGAPAREYLRARGISEDTARQLGLGYAPGHGTLRALFERGVHPTSVAQAKLVVGVATDALSERLVFPVRSLGGQVVFLIGRALRPRQRPKYLGLSLPKAPMVFGEPVLGTLVVEGAVDLAALAQWGYGRYYRLVAMLGTGERAVLPYLVGPVTVLPDQDGAGWGAARRLAEALQPGRTVRVLVCRQAYARLRAAGDAAALAHAQALLDAGVVVGVEWGGAKDVGDLLQRGESGRAALGIGD
jgi:DNA primase